MTRLARLVLVALTVGLAGACRPSLSAADAQGRPRCSIQAPLQGSVLPFGPVEVVAEATHPTGISHVELCVDGALFAVSATPDPGKNPATMRWVWEPGLAGTYVLQARARSADGRWGQYARVVVTIKPEEPTPTPTPIPTATVAPSATSTATPTPTLTPTRQPPRTAAAPQITPTPEVVATDSGPGPADGPKIAGPRASTAHFYYGGTSCGPQEITITVEVSDPSGVASVGIHYVLADKATGAMTVWSRRDMTPADGRWSCTIEPARDIPRYDAFRNAWFQVYFVAVNSKGQESKSPGYYTAYTLSQCAG